MEIVDHFNPNGDPDTLCDECGVVFYAGIGSSVICDACLAAREKEPPIMWRTQVFTGTTLALDHAQPDFMKVLRFTMNALVELVNQNVQDYRVVMADKQGTVFFFAIGPTTQTADAMKVVMEPSA